MDDKNILSTVSIPKKHHFAVPKTVPIYSLRLPLQSVFGTFTVLGKHRSLETRQGCKNLAELLKYGELHFWHCITKQKSLERVNHMRGV
jgi:hypothetical protein